MVNPLPWVLAFHKTAEVHFDDVTRRLSADGNTDTLGAILSLNNADYTTHGCEMDNLL